MDEEKEANKITPIEKFPYWDIVYEQQMWDDYLAWCREQENGAHE